MKLNLRTSLFLLVARSTLFLRCQAPPEARNVLWTTAWSPDGTFIAVGGKQGDLKLFDGKTFQLIKTYPVPEVILSRLKWHPRRNLLVPSELSIWPDKTQAFFRGARKKR